MSVLVYCSDTPTGRSEEAAPVHPGVQIIAHFQKSGTGRWYLMTSMKELLGGRLSTTVTGGRDHHHVGGFPIPGDDLDRFEATRLPRYDFATGPTTDHIDAQHLQMLCRPCGKSLRAWGRGLVPVLDAFAGGGQSSVYFPTLIAAYYRRLGRTTTL